MNELKTENTNVHTGSSLDSFLTEEGITLKDQIQTDIDAKVEAKAANPETAGLDVAAQYFKLYTPIFKNNVKHLSRKQLVRLISALIEYPLQTVPYKHSEKFEKDAFLVGDKLLQSKYMMIMYTMAHSQQVNDAIEEKVEELDNVDKT